MTRWTIIARSLRFHARSHAGTVAGAAVAAAVLTGALAVGDSVRHTLRGQALQRLGEVRAAVIQHDRFFRSALAAELQTGFQTNTAVSAILRLNATAQHPESKARANQVQLLGVAEDFWKQGATRGAAPAALPDESAFINPQLAAQLKLKVGDTFNLRIAKPSVLPRDAPLAVAEDLTVRLQLRVAGVLDAQTQLADFNLRPGATPPHNVFVRLDWLQQKAGLPGRANLLLAGGEGDAPTITSQANQLLREGWQLADADLELRELPQHGVIELRTDRIFLDAPALTAAREAGGAHTVLTYLVNELRHGKNAVPYSMVTAVENTAPPLAASSDLPKDAVIVNQWLATDLGVKAGDALSLSYYVLGLNRQLEERNATFTVAGVVPTGGRGGDRELMPNFPGIAGVDEIRNWEPGIDVDLKKIRDQDEDYWKEHRGTPKAFLPLAAGQSLWGNRYGNATAVRFEYAPGRRAQIEQTLRSRLDPASIGLQFRDVRSFALDGRAANDFGVLFVSLSFFLMAAALILMGLLFVFGTEQRAPQVGTLLAIGFTGRQVRNLLLAEGAVIAVLGAVLGAWAGLGYTQLLTHGLSTVWAGALGSGSITYHVQPLTVAIGMLGGVGMALFTIWLTVRRLREAQAATLLNAGMHEARHQVQSHRKSLVIAAACLLGALVLAALMKGAAGQAKAGGFFGAGALLLVACLCACHAWLGHLSRAGGDTFASLGAMGWRGGARRRGRSLACISLLACGIFLVVAVGAFRIQPEKEMGVRASGTGGFTFFGMADVPVLHDLNTAAGREKMAVNGAKVPAGSLVQMRLREGDDASCLNLNQPREPRLLGVQPTALAKRQAFVFAATEKGEDGLRGWDLLSRRYPDGAVPAVVDMNTGMWALHKRVGDTLDYPDERGGIFRIRIVGMLAGSMLQGDLLIAEDRFVERFPSSAGYRVLLVDAADAAAADMARKELEFALEDHGLELTLTGERLAAFSRVQNTYLDIFQAIGGLALLLGSAGLGVIVLRNVLERRGELALLEAVGFGKGALRWLVWAEHGGLLVLGTLAGVISAVLAVWPAMDSPGHGLQLELLALTVGAILLSGMIWIWLAATLALRGELMAALRSE